MLKHMKKLIDNLSEAENRPLDVIQNRLSNQLVHRYGKGKWMRGKELEELAKKKYNINGRGITFSDVIEKFNCSKDQAQLRLKNACIEKIDKYGKKSSILFRLDNKRTIPQQYFPSSIKATIIENKRNRLIEPTGVSYNNKASYYCPLHHAIEQQIVQSFLTQLYLLPFQPLNMHNIHLWTNIDKNHYEGINQKPWHVNNKTKIISERIGLREVIYHFNKKGSIQIEISCSKNPFPLETNDNINNFFVFMGQVKDRLAYILHDPRERIVPPVDKWILKYCDFNKDIDIEGKKIGQLMGLNIQVKHMGEAFRLYIKNLGDIFALREEKLLKVNKPITSFINDSVLNPLYMIDTKFNEFTKLLQKELKEINNKIEKLEKEK
jgi:hypothetical protein